MLRTTKSLTCLLFLCCWLCPLTAGAAALDFTAHQAGFSDGGARMLGWQFEVTQNIQVTSLGWFDFNTDGLAFAHEIGIWDLNSQTLLASTIVPNGTAGTLSSFFRYASLGALGLTPGVTYLIAGFDQGIDPHVWDVLLPSFPGREVIGFSVDPSILLGPAGSARGPFAGAFSFPTTTVGDTRHALMGPNFQFTTRTVGQTPEPGTIGLATAGLLSAAAARKRRKSA